MSNAAFRWVALVCVFILTMLIAFMGWMNVNTTNAARAFEYEANIQKTKSEYWKQKYNNLIQSGTCLDQMPKYEEVIG